MSSLPNIVLIMHARYDPRSSSRKNLADSPTRPGHQACEHHRFIHQLFQLDASIWSPLTSASAPPPPLQCQGLRGLTVTLSTSP